jgi:spore coat protein I
VGGQKMNEKSLEVLKQYNLDIKRTVRGRGGMLLDTRDGMKLFLECVRSDGYYEREDAITSAVSANGFENVDTYVRNSGGELVSADEEGRHYVVKNWFDGRECNVKDIGDICGSVKVLARLHNVLENVSPGDVKDTSVVMLSADEKAETPMRENYKRHMKELKLAGNYLKNKKRKSGFEQTAYKNIGHFYNEAQEAVKLMESPQLDKRFFKAMADFELCHGSFNYHNVLFDGSEAAVTNFDHYRIECRVSDLYQFMRKIMEKYDWDIQLAYKMIDEYDKIRSISDEDLEVLKALFAFPEKFWKVMNYYFNSNKAWIPPKTIEKLEKAVAQNDKRLKFLETVL